MRKTLFTILLLILSLSLADTILAQRSDPNLKRIGYHTGNRVGISFYNDGQISGFNQGIDIRGEWPFGSGENYIGDCIPLIGVEFITRDNEAKHSVVISRGPRRGQSDERHPQFGYFWGWNPMPGFLNPESESVAMSHLPNSWPVGGWRDQPSYVDANGKTVWNGYFGKGVVQADQESYYWADDQWDDEFNGNFKPDSRDTTRNGMALQMAVRGFQWASFLAEDVIFWLYDIKNEGTTIYRRAAFGTVVGTLAGGDGDSQDDLGSFDPNDAITYSWDSDGVGNKGQRVGYVGYAFLESPGNPFDGIDNDDDSGDPNVPRFTLASFDSVTYNVGDRIVLIDPATYARTIVTVQAGINTVNSLGRTISFTPGVTYFREGHIAQILNGVAIPDTTANDGFDNDLDGNIDENQAIHYEARRIKGLLPLKYINYLTGAGVNDPLIDEKRDNAAGGLVTTYVKGPNNSSRLVTHFAGDEDADWTARDTATLDIRDDVGSDGVGPFDEGYVGPDADGTEGNGTPDQGEPNFGRTDPDESDQIGLTSFNFFELGSAPDLSQDEVLWTRMNPGRFDVIPPNPQDGDFIYASGYFPLVPDKIERFSVSLLFGETYDDIVRNKKVVQQIYNSGYKFPQPPRKPKLTVTQDDGKAVLYWEGRSSENSIDFITKLKDFEGYKVYRATDAGFIDARQITNAFGVLSFDKPLAQYDIKGNGVKGFFYPSPDLLEQVGGTTFYLGNDTSGIVNRYVDSTVIRGVRYYYGVAAYDKGDAGLNIFPSENPIKIFRTNTGEIVTDDNTGYITTGNRGVGYVDASVDTISTQFVKIGTGKVGVEVVDDAVVKPSVTYKIAFTDTSLQRYTRDWYLINKNSGDTLVKRETIFTGSTPIVDGLRLQIFNDATINIDTLRSGWVNAPYDTVPSYAFSVLQIGNNRGTIIGYDYELEFFPDIVDTSVGDTLQPPTSSNRFPRKNANFKVKNLTTGEYIDFVYYTTGNLSTVHNVYFRETINGQYLRTWRINLFYNYGSAPLLTSGKLRLYTRKPFTSDDSFEFKVNQSRIDAMSAKDNMDKINVVPNPYVVTHQGEERLLSTQTSGRGEREIRFTHIPPGSKITIYTVRGELIKTLYHSDLYVGDVYWNLRTEENLDAAYGVYVYVVEIPEVGKKVGKFALIK
ncbi:MAG: hypothetical protein L6Q59_01740 [Ignavibacteriaceae bacterium]|nr:hypothetical protein [Ignavibacteriaceae bacterium]